MMAIIRTSLAGLAAAAALAACSGGEQGFDPDVVCHVGAYRTADGALVDFGPLSSPTLRWRTMDGRTGRISPPEDGEAPWSGVEGWTERAHPARFQFGACGEGRVVVSGLDGVDGPAERLDFQIEETTFEGADGVTLAGRLVMPQGEEAVPLVVLVHGSEASSARDFYYLQRLLPSENIAVFVYDKRGTGASSGDYTQDFDRLAADAAAALAEARRLAGDRVSSAGYQGGSQGGWVAPYAATMSEADFVVASFGMAEGPLAEDREEVLLNMRAAGYGQDAEAMAGARALAEAAGRVMASDFAEGVSELAALKRRYRDEAWYDGVQGEFTHEFLVRPIWQVRMAMPFFDRGTSWDYDARSVLARLDTPMLWVLAADDTEAPPDTTRAILSDLQAEGRPIDIAVFPGADHGIVEYETGPDGMRVSTRYSAGYFRMLADWIRDPVLRGDYGRASLAPRPAASGGAE